LVKIGQNYATVCPILTYLWHHSWTVLFDSVNEMLSSARYRDLLVELVQLFISLFFHLQHLWLLSHLPPQLHHLSLELLKSLAALLSHSAHDTTDKFWHKFFVLSNTPQGAVFHHDSQPFRHHVWHTTTINNQLDPVLETLNVASAAARLPAVPLSRCGLQNKKVVFHNFSGSFHVHFQDLPRPFMSTFYVFPVLFNGMNIEQVRLSYIHMLINSRKTCFKRQSDSKQW